MWTKKKVEDSEHFCVFPWVQLASRPHGTAHLCCLFQEKLQSDDGKPYNLKTDSLSEIWNSSAVRELRSQSYNDHPMRGCESCVKEDSLGGSSFRKRMNTEWLEVMGDDLLNKINQSPDTGFSLEGIPSYFDLRLGNHCNLKCRSCCSESSSKFQKEGRELSASNTKYKNYWSDVEGDLNWHENEEFWNTLQKNKKDIRRLYLTGGEPTLIKDYLPFLKSCVANGDAKNIAIQINTNLTFYNEPLIELLSSFQHVNVSVSIDAIGKQAEYLRNPTKWPVVEKNLKRYLSLPDHFIIVATPVIQATTLMSLPTLLGYVENLRFEFEKALLVSPIILHFPDFLEANILPQTIRERAVSQLKDYMASSILFDKDPGLIHRLTEVVSYVGSNEISNSKLERFLEYNRILDKHRNEKFEEVFSELSEELQKFVRRGSEALQRPNSAFL